MERSPNAVARMDTSGMATAEIVLIQGDLSVLTPPQRVEYYRQVCESIGLNPLTKPFDYIVLNGKLTLYAKKDCTDQIRTLRSISVTKLEREQTADTVDVTAYGRAKDGREDASLGSVAITGLRGEALANAKMKAETKAKRRLTLSLAGLGWLDETEVGTVPSAQPVVVTEAGEIIEDKPKTLAEAVARAVAPSVTPEPPEEADGPPVPPPAPEGQEDTTEPPPDDTDEQDEGPEPDGGPGVDTKTFLTWVSSEAFVPTALVKKVAGEMFAGAKSVRDLTDQQRLALQEELTKRLNAGRTA